MPRGKRCLSLWGQAPSQPLGQQWHFGLPSPPLWTKQGLQNLLRRWNNLYRLFKAFFFSLVMALTAVAWAKLLLEEATPGIPALPSTIHLTLLGIPASPSAKCKLPENRGWLSFLPVLHEKMLPQNALLKGAAGQVVLRDGIESLHFQRRTGWKHLLLVTAHPAAQPA